MTENQIRTTSDDTEVRVRPATRRTGPPSSGCG